MLATPVVILLSSGRGGSGSSSNLQDSKGDASVCVMAPASNGEISTCLDHPRPNAVASITLQLHQPTTHAHLVVPCTHTPIQTL